MRTRPLLKLRRAFTLVELLIVIIIIAVLAAIAIPKFANSSLKSKESSLRANLKIARNGIEMFKMDTGLLPQTLADLSATTAPTQGLNSAGTATNIAAGAYKGPYVQSIPTDPVSGSAFTYTTTAGASLGNVNSSATGNDSTGAAYSTY